MKRDEVLDLAKVTLVDRGADYGDARVNFDRIAVMWTVIMGQKVTRAQVAQCMICLKLSRLAETPSHEDSWLDIVAYAALGSEVRE
jgi:hypothetical protein